MFYKYLFKFSVFQYLSNTNSQLWALVNNAGVLVYGQADWLTEEQVISQVNVNYVAVWRVTKAFLPLIRKSKGINRNFYKSCFFLQSFESLFIQEEL